MEEDGLAAGGDRPAVDVPVGSQNVTAIVTGWLRRFGASISSGDAAGLQGLFAVDGWLKDELVFSWDTRALQGVSVIAEYILQNSLPDPIRKLEISINPNLLPALKIMGPMTWIESGFEFETNVGRGRGIVRLVDSGVGDWKAWIVFTTLTELKGHPRKGGDTSTDFYKQPQSMPEKDGEATQPTVVVVGGASSGLAVAASLHNLGVRTLVVERSHDVGDVWRKRYKRLQLHSPSYGDARPFLDVPSEMPTFPGKDEYADYLSSYARKMGINIWLNTEFKSAKYDDQSGRWTVQTISTTGDCLRNLHPRHIVWACGAISQDHPIIPTLPGRDEFKGVFYHAGEHQDAAITPNVREKRVVVIGSGTTAHDICQDYFEAGANVTMIQRSSTIVCSPEAAIRFAMPPPAKGQTNEEYVFGLRSFPMLVSFGITAQATQLMLQFDSELIKGLDDTEFVVSKGEGGDSFLRRGVLTRGGFYVNQGASDLIAAKKINVMNCPGGATAMTASEIVLADGRTAPADIIVAATGWHNIEDTLAAAIGEEEAGRASQVYHAPTMDGEGQSPGMFRQTGHPGFWVAGGNLLGGTMGAPVLALQILAVESGLNKTGR